MNISQKNYFFFLEILAPDFLAMLNAAAIACFLGWPALIISRILLEMTFLDFPFFKGIVFPVFSHYRDSKLI